MIDSRRWQAALVAGLLSLYVILAVSAASGKSVTFDEIEQLTSGYFLWTAPTYRVAPENGIFAQKWAALPLVLEHPKIPVERGEPWGFMGNWGPYYRFFYSSGNDPGKMLLSGRFMISLLGAALGALVYLWSRELFGARGGMVSLIMFIFCPTMLANGAVVTADMSAALGFFAATFFFWRLSHVVAWKNLLLSVGALALLVLSKMSAVLIVPIFALILVVRLCSGRSVEFQIFNESIVFAKRPARLAIWFLLLALHLVVVLVALGLFYNFTYYDIGRTSTQLQAWLQAPPTIFSGAGLKANFLLTTAHFGLLPPAYWNGLGFTLAEAEGRNAFLWGHFSQSGWIWFFPFSFLVKTPVASLFLFPLGLVALVSRKVIPRYAGQEGPSLYDLSPLLILGGVYGIASLASHLNIGHRHIMPLYPVLFVLAGANVFWWRGGRAFRVALGVLILGLVAESLAAWPNYLAFFNQIVGGPRQGYHYLVDSSLDWGQDLPGLRRWLDKNVPAGSSTPVYLSYFGTGDPSFYGIQAQLLPCYFDLKTPQEFALRGGVYCISATMLQADCTWFPPPWTARYEYLYRASGSDWQNWIASAHDPAVRAGLVKERGADFWPAAIAFYGELRLDRLCVYLRHRTPDDNVGGSILVYRLTDDEVKEALTGPVVEEAR